ncbi:MAG: protein-(glutamine-N5) methyltransferase, release factor-specific [Spirochaetes bacterium RBG_13_51_14]|nr:MAG: protein-(glutamine-N5) methyltransferase, release factor-specific [Spirochaetes bacterium RBG_13_51_14]
MDAELLISHALDTERFRLHAVDDRELTADELRRINRLIRRRVQFEPIAYILGRKEFYSLDFIVNRHVLIPRPETELLVDLTVYHARQNAPVVDIGTGSGAIAISVKHSRSDLEVHATDISSEALATARKNAARILGRNRIRFHRGDLFKPLSGMRFQVIAVNPPYVDKKCALWLQKDLSFEPEVALFSGRKGRETIERVIAGSGGHLTDDGVLIMEIGDDMMDFIKKAGKGKGYSVSVLNDYSGLPRVAVMNR